MLSATTTFDRAAKRVWDAVIVGAGPAGAMAAGRLARLGRSVLLVDKSAFPREKVCGCCISAAAIQTLKSAGIELPSFPNSSELRGMCLAAEGRTASFSLPPGVIISRCDFDSHLIRVAIAAGVDFLPRTLARETLHDADSRSVTLVAGSQQFKVRGRVILVAEGIHGQLLRSDRSLRVRPDARIGVATTLHCASSDYAPNSVYMACADSGYVGLVRFADGSLHIAAAIDPAVTRRMGVGCAVEAIVCKAGLPPPDDLKNAAWQGTIPLTRTRGQIASNRLFVLGDATGYVEPFTGEGIAWSLASGQAVAPLVDAAIRQWSDRFISDWTILQNRLIRRRQLICRASARALRHPRLISWTVRAVRLMPSLATPFTGMLNFPYLLTQSDGRTPLQPSPIR